VHLKLGKSLNTRIQISIIGICFIIFCLPFPSLAQSKILQTKIQIKASSQKVRAVIQEIENNTTIEFSYSDNVLDNKTINLSSPTEMTLKKFLDEVLLYQDIGYKLLGSHVVLFEKKAPPKWFTLSGFIANALNSENIIGAAVFIKELGIGTITNPYGFYSIKIPAGNYTLVFSSLGYNLTTHNFTLNYNIRSDIKLDPKSYNVSEVTVSTRQNSEFLESTLMNMIKIDIKSLQDLPGLFGENDALRNLTVLPGIQANELSTSSINVRGGGTDQTTFLMDESCLYSASHFGGFFSVFNPDVVNNVNVYKSDIPVSESGALSSLINVHLREGNNKEWHVKGGVGLISARGLVEGPLKKEKSSVLFAFRRTYVDNVTRMVNLDSEFNNARFYFYDANLKLNYQINDNNRFYISGYTGSDVFSQYTRLSNTNYMGSARWNHLFGPRMFSNTTISASQNFMTQGTQIEKELIYWKSEINDVKLKSDFSYHYSKAFKLSFGIASTLFNIFPYSLLTETEQDLLTRYKSSVDRMMLNSFYVQDEVVIRQKLGIDAGIRVTHMQTQPFTDSLIGISKVYWQPQLRLSYAINKISTLKASYSYQVQPLHQLPLSMVGVAVNRWMSSSQVFEPQISSNYTFGYYNTSLISTNFSTEMYYREMGNLIETMQDMRILYTDDPEEYLHRASGTAMGVELLVSFIINKFKGMLSYDYCKAMWRTRNLNNGNPYEAAHTRKHTINLAGVYRFNKRMTLSTSWMLASGIPYTAANGKYTINGRTYLQFNGQKINTKKLPPYHRLDISLDIASKKNGVKKWKSFWNFSVYNAYLRKNALGVAYFIPDTEDGVTVQKLNPGFFYLYQFVPSVSYRFEF
jgi:hypothetical protein